MGASRSFRSNRIGRRFKIMLEPVNADAASWKPNGHLAPAGKQ